MESNKDCIKPFPENKNKAQNTDLMTLFRDFAQVYRFYDQDKVQDEMLALFKENSPGAMTCSPEKLVERILEAARGLRRSALENQNLDSNISHDVYTDLAGKLYELAINQPLSTNKEDLIREITFFYLSADKAQDFLIWSKTLLEVVSDDHPELRATLFAIGLAQIFTNSSDQAVFTFRRLKMNFPDAAESFFGLALAYIKLNEFDQLARMYDELRKRAPELAEIAIRLSEIENFTAADYASEMELLDDKESFS